MNLLHYIERENKYYSVNNNLQEIPKIYFIKPNATNKKIKRQIKILK